MRAALGQWLLCAALLCTLGAAHAGTLRYCDAPVDLGTAHKGLLLQFAGVVKDELDRTGQEVAVVSRSGLDLKRFDVRYSHTGLSLKASANGPWSVRQLYYACDEHLPRIYDQGMSGFVFGTDDARSGFISVVLLPEVPARMLEQAALDNTRALELLSASYSANAFAFSLAYQNCNQWVIELMASAWNDAASSLSGAQRAQSQAWLRERHYQPSVIDVHYRPMMWLGAFIPWVHSDDHPADDLAANRFRVSMPAAIEAFLHEQFPDAQRIEFCRKDRQVVIHRGWSAISDDCLPDAQDLVVVLD
jgi:hypothetical protein